MKYETLGHTDAYTLLFYVLYTLVLQFYLFSITFCDMTLSAILLSYIHIAFIRNDSILVDKKRNMLRLAVLFLSGLDYKFLI